MSGRATKPALVQPASGSFGFEPDESVSHFLVRIPTGNRAPVDISEHLSWDPATGEDHEAVHLNPEVDDGQLRVRLARPKWDLIADAVREEFNPRLKREGKRIGKWRTGQNFVTRILGKELVLLSWAIEDADPSLVPMAIANWRGLRPEERWWLYTMTAAATGNYHTGRNRGWRKAVRYALTENPASAVLSDSPVVPEFFRLVSETADEPRPLAETK